MIKSNTTLPISITSTSHNVLSASQSNWARKRDKGKQTGKEEVNSYFFVNVMNLRVKNLKDYIEKPLELTNELRKLQDTKLVYESHCISVH